MSRADVWLKRTTAWRLGKLFADPARRTFAKIVRGDRIPLFWHDIPNWGDALNPYLVRKLSGREVQQANALYHDRYLVVGSVLAGANANAEVWGSGFIHDHEKVMAPPRAIHAVRGPLSRAALRLQGIACPEVFGDPALLMPLVFNPAVSKTYSLGLVPHYVDKAHPWLARCARDPSVLVVDVESETEEFVRMIKSCEVIASSSLHGLICADAYGIPNIWIKLTDDLIGGDFKFRDYRSAIGARIPKPVRIRPNLEPASVREMANIFKVGIDLRALLLACPFLSPELRRMAVVGHLVPCALGER